MLAKYSFALLASLATLGFAAAAAAGNPTTTIPSIPKTTVTPPASQCNTAPVQCCNSTTTAGAPAAAEILSLIGVVVQDLDIVVGLTCNPITIVGVGSGGSCSASPVCCDDNNFGGLISINCSPVDLSL
ncbi:hypothetical protein EW146_g6112 [Bondarzewia mesenterica]|uniref:Hydrophobin n=1 Tax=Bondarzewia mesenterica TaxID=1095465 RepID=A0A4S4LRM0_9AGAM|nr:hypothetical protein EW146_g6112 [Bondarzewia mesenterica]